MTEHDLKTIVRNNIKRYREYRKWTQAQLAEKLNISINFLSDIENGKKWFSLATIVKFASILNIEPFELFKPTEAPTPTVSVLFSRYNDEVTQAISESVKKVSAYYQTLIENNPLTEKDTSKSDQKGTIKLQGTVSKNKYSKLIAKNAKR